MTGAAIFSTDHSLRRRDLSLFPWASRDAASVPSGFAGGRFVAGRSKEAQRFASCLLTPLGSVPSDPEMGSEIPGYVRARSNMSFFHDADSVASAESLRVVEWIFSRLPEGRPPDEVIESAEVLSWSPGAVSLDLSIRLLFADGEPGTVLVPVGFPVPERSGAPILPGRL